MTTERIERAREKAVDEFGTKDSRDDAWVAIDGFLDALAADGLVIVPREPTEEMIRAARQEPQRSDIYKAMIAAALKEQG
jgi:Na+-transporting NADH:ubiquinone oxidoreductase subunit NqrB